MTGVRSQPRVARFRDGRRATSSTTAVVEEGAITTALVEEGALAPVSKPPSPALGSKQ